jgi:Flp pilus assembly protein TadD
MHRLKNINSKYFHARREVFILVMLVLMVLGVYGQTFYFEFVGFDDDRFLLENPNVRNGLTIESISWAFEIGKITTWHPLTWLVYMLNVDLVGLHPGGHHMTNVILHILNTLLLFTLLNKMTGEMWKSVAVTAFFAIHPINAESVAWVAELKNVLSTFFWMLTMLAYFYYCIRPGVVRYFSVLLLFIAGLLCKPMLVTLPCVLLLMDYWPLKRLVIRPSTKDPYPNASQEISSRLTPVSLGFGLLEKIPFFIFSGVSIYLSSLSLMNQGLAVSDEVAPMTLRIANAIVIYVRYIWKLIWPEHLTFYYPYPESIPIWQSTGAFLIIAGITIMLLRWIKEQPSLTIGWLWFLGTLVPVSGLVQAGLWPAMADRYAYIPMIGFFITVCWGAAALAHRMHLKKGVLIVITSVAVIFYGLAGRTQTGYWENSYTLFEHAIAVTDGNWISYNNLGYALMARGRTEEAIENFKKAIKVKPGLEDPYVNIGLALMAKGRIEESRDYYLSVLSIKPNFAKVHNNLGVIELQTGHVEKAIQYFIRAIQIDPHYAAAYNGLGTAQAYQGKNEKAIDSFKKALQINPDYAMARRNLDQIETLKTDPAEKNESKPASRKK